ncbi:hypothetical protein A4A49_00351 [Nicotiana attenuata]|uniref:Uncharacterized protein n=1 Tax=Nicotiana attenuata TaxID=49451 RepID=A0A1J6IWB5_NICAT|nr:hypothetical protein A4A49_00351 [Nicotiana attenuata]
MIDKDPPKPTHDVPARTTLARLFSAVNPVVQAYDELALNKAATGLTTDEVPKFAADRTEGAIQIGKANDGIAAGDRTNVRQPHEGVVALDNRVPSVTNLKTIVDCTDAPIQSGIKSVNVEAKLPNAQAEKVQGFEQGTLAHGTGVATNVELVVQAASLDAEVDIESGAEGFDNLGLLLSFLQFLGSLIQGRNSLMFNKYQVKNQQTMLVLLLVLRLAI